MEQEEEITEQEYDGTDDLRREESVTQSDPSVIHLQIISSEVVREYKDELTGVLRDRNGNMMKDETGRVITDPDPLCNFYGANKLVSYVRASVSKNVTLANLEDKQIKTNLKALSVDLTIQLAKNYKEYGIDFRRLTQVLQLTITYMESNFSRSLRGFTSKMIGRETRVSEVRSSNEQKRTPIFG